MLVNVRLAKSSISFWLLFVFAFALFLGTMSSEFFQAPKTSSQELDKYRLFLKKEELEGIDQLKLTNRLGSFNFRKIHDGNRAGNWELKEPKELPARQEMIDKILNVLSQLKIRKIYNKDTINLGNFSLDRPQITLEYSSPGNQAQTVYTGLVNPIDNSTYITSDGVNSIYHIDALNSPLGGLDLGEFVDSHIFSLVQSDLRSYKLFKSQGGSSKRVQVEFSRDKEGWKDSKGKLLGPDRVEKYLSSVLSLKSTMILDSQTDKLQERINQLVQKAAYRIEIEDKNGLPVTYAITGVIGVLPDMKMEKNQNFLIKASNRRFPFLVQKDHIKPFYQRQNYFKKLSIKKLFY